MFSRVHYDKCNNQNNSSCKQNQNILNYTLNLNPHENLRQSNINCGSNLSYYSKDRSKQISIENEIKGLNYKNSNCDSNKTQLCSSNSASEYCNIKPAVKLLGDKNVRCYGDPTCNGNNVNC